VANARPRSGGSTGEISGPEFRLTIVIDLPDDNPFMLRRRIGHLDIAALDLEEPRTQGGQIAVGIADLMQEPSGGDTQRFPDFRHDPPLRFPIFIPEHPGLIAGQIEGVNLLPEIAEHPAQADQLRLRAAITGYVRCLLSCFRGGLHLMKITRPACVFPPLCY